MTSVTLEQAIAATRFGFGARPTDFAAMGSDAQGWLRAQTNPGNDSLITTPLPSTQEFFEADWGGVPSPTMAAAGLDNMSLFDYSLRVRSRFAQQTTMPFRERLVRFWSNHFSTTGKGDSAPIVEVFEREAIRPNVMGTFEQMLLASTKHPIMNGYLENTLSAGPNSQYGSTPGRGINENLAREIMELHTLGAGSGYTQADVTSFAEVISGWTYSSPSNGARPYGVFYFEPAFHEPGPQTILGTTYSQPDINQGLAVLHDFANNPATIDHVCTKLAIAFHSDTPPQSLIDQLKSAWTSSGGNLSTIANALIAAPEMWLATQGKVKTPDDLWTSLLRAIDPAWPADWSNMWAYLCFGAPPFSAPSPAGWPALNSNWACPGSLCARIQLLINIDNWIESILPGTVSDLAQNILGPLLQPATMSAIQAATSTHSALTILFMSPEFQRR